MRTLYRAWKVRSTFFGAGAPEDFAEWCLRRAVEVARLVWRVALALLEWSRPWHEGDSGSGVSIEDVREATRDVPALREEVELILTPPRESKELMRLREEHREYAGAETKKGRVHRTGSRLRARAAAGPMCARPPGSHRPRLP